jgi:SAM-dependent methyltransferase
VQRDPTYLRDVQYRDPTKLAARATLHAKYSTAAAPWPAWVLAQIEWAAVRDVLEVGCGPGWLWDGTRALPDGLQLTLTDLSPGMVENARQRITRSPTFPVVDVREADAQSLPFADQSFDVVMANHMLYHVPDPARAVSELARVVRPGGVVMTATNGAGHLRPLWEIKAEVFGGRPESENPAVFGSVTGRPILDHSFARVQWRTYEDSLRCTDPDDVVAVLTSSPPGENASPEQRADLRRLVVARIEAGGGVFEVAKETGVFLSGEPRCSL